MRALRRLCRRSPATASFTCRHGSQVAGTLAKYFARQRDLVLLAVDPERLGERLRWETSRGGELFPHLYGPLDLAHVISVEPLELQEDGSHRLPKGIAP